MVDDPDHQRADERVAALQAKRRPLVTSNFVVAESLTRLRYDGSLRVALNLADLVDGLQAVGRLDLVLVDGVLWDDALTWFRRYEDQKFSFVDCTSFAIMAAEGIQEVLTADHHFATAGFTPLG